jgi:hypothetical protein
MLKEIGAAPKLTEESRSEPSLDFAWGPAPADGVTARQWAEDWVGQPVAVLDFHTPRHAAEGGQAERLRLEGLLRQLEHQSALPAARGGRAVDTAWLRAELGLGLDGNGSESTGTASAAPLTLLRRRGSEDLGNQPIRQFFLEYRERDQWRPTQ